MHAVIRTGGKQYRVAAQDVIRVEKVTGDEGDVVVFDEVLAVGSELGAPLVSGASVAGRVVAQARADKIIVFKKKRRKNYRRKLGHRQDLTIIRIEEILTGGKKASTAKKAAPKKDEPKKDAPQKDASKKDEAKAEAKPAPKAETKAKKPETKAAEKPAAKKEATKASDKAAEKAADDAPMFKRPAGDPDDLKKISGVGPVIEKKLHALGITKYAQIAAFTKDEIDQVDEVLNFKGRIERDDWLGQAKTLADEA